MKITYDRDVDLLAFLLSDDYVEVTKNIAPGVEVDYDSNGRVVAIEFLNASEDYDLRGVELQSPDPWFSLAAAGAMFGLSPTTLRHQIERGALHGVKAGRNWLVHRDDLHDYVEKRSRKAKLPAAARNPATA